MHRQIARRHIAQFDDDHLLKPIGDLEQACESPEGPHERELLIFTTDGLVEAAVRTRTRTAILRCDDHRWVSSAPGRYDACGHSGSVSALLALRGDGDGHHSPGNVYAPHRSSAPVASMARNGSNPSSANVGRQRRMGVYFLSHEKWANLRIIP